MEPVGTSWNHLEVFKTVVPAHAASQCPAHGWESIFKVASMTAFHLGSPVREITSQPSRLTPHGLDRLGPLVSGLSTLAHVGLTLIAK